MLKKYIILVFLSVTLSISADERYLSVAYFGELVSHPGIVLSIENPILSRNNSNIFWTIRGGGYNHYMSNSTLFIGSEFGYRKNWNSGFDFHSQIGISYMHKFLDSPIYEVSSESELVRVKDYGTSHLMPNISLGFGYTFNRGKGREVNIFSRTEIFGEYPYNTYILPHVSFCLGFRTKV